MAIKVSASKKMLLLIFLISTAFLVLLIVFSFQKNAKYANYIEIQAIFKNEQTLTLGDTVYSEYTYEYTINDKIYLGITSNKYKEAENIGNSCRVFYNPNNLNDIKDPAWFDQMKVFLIIFGFWEFLLVVGLIKTRKNKNTNEVLTSERTI